MQKNWLIKRNLTLVLKHHYARYIIHNYERMLHGKGTARTVRCAVGEFISQSARSVYLHQTSQLQYLNVERLCMCCSSPSLLPLSLSLSLLSLCPTFPLSLSFSSPLSSLLSPLSSLLPPLLIVPKTSRDSRSKWRWRRRWCRRRCVLDRDRDRVTE